MNKIQQKRQKNAAWLIGSILLCIITLALIKYNIDNITVVVFLVVPLILFIAWIYHSATRTRWTNDQWNDHIIREEREHDKLDRQLKAVNDNRQRLQEKCEYISGHPYIDDPMDVSLKIAETSVEILDPISGNVLASISLSDIHNSSIEDATTVEKRVGIKRLLLVGIFALAWRKKKVNNQWFLVIEWEQKIANETIFSFSGADAHALALKFSNKLKRHILERKD